MVQYADSRRCAVCTVSVTRLDDSSAGAGETLLAELLLIHEQLGRLVPVGKVQPVFQFVVVVVGQLKGDGLMLH